MDITSPWHGTCAECGGPISRLTIGPCQVPHRFDERSGRLIVCGLPMGAQNNFEAEGRELHEWDGGWVHTKPGGLCICKHPYHEGDCEECAWDVGRFMAGAHDYTPWEAIESDHEPVFRREGAAA